MSIRLQLAEQLEQLLPGIKIIPNSRNVDSLGTTPAVQISLQTITPLPEAPAGANLATFTVTIVTPHTDPEQAEDDLDDLVGDLLTALDKLEVLDWSEARKVLWDDRHLAYDVTVTAVTEPNE